MAAILVELFKHNTWANLRLLDACAGLSDEHLGASAPGTYGRAGDTLVHLVAAQDRYLALLTGTQPESPSREGDPFPGVPALRERVRRSGEVTSGSGPCGANRSAMAAAWACPVASRPGSRSSPHPAAARPWRTSTTRAIR